jgi:hypothetical protein
MDESLRDLESLLRKHGFSGQADAVAHVLALHRTGDRAAFAQAAMALVCGAVQGALRTPSFAPIPLAHPRKWPPTYRDSIGRWLRWPTGWSINTLGSQARVT